MLTTSETTLVPDVATDPNLNNMVFASLARPWTDNGNPSVKQMNDVIAQCAPSLSNVGHAHVGWTSAKLLEYASTFFPANPTITSKDILAAMDKVKNYDVGGMTGPLTFTAGKSAPQVRCYWTMKVSNGKFTTPVGTARKCI